MQIKVLEEKFIDGAAVFLKGEVREVDQESGEYFCSLGWAEDVSGAVSTGARQKDGEVVLDVRGSKHSQTTTEL